MRLSLWGRAFCKKIGPKTPISVNEKLTPARCEQLTKCACCKNDKEQANSKLDVVVTLANLAADWLVAFALSNAVSVDGQHTDSDIQKSLGTYSTPAWKWQC